MYLMFVSQMKNLAKTCEAVFANSKRLVFINMFKDLESVVSKMLKLRQLLVMLKKKVQMLQLCHAAFLMPDSSFASQG